MTCCMRLPRCSTGFAIDGKPESRYSKYTLTHIRLQCHVRIASSHILRGAGTVRQSRWRKVCGMTTGKPSKSSPTTYIASDDRTAHKTVASCPSDQPGITHYFVTMNERGQVVLPAEVRNACHIRPHEKLLVFRDPSAASALVLVKIDQLPELVRWSSKGDYR